MRRIRDSLHKRKPGGHNVEIRDHSAWLWPPPAGGLGAGSWRNRLCQEPPGGTALWGSDFDMAISDTLDRTYVLGRDCGVCVGKGRLVGTAYAVDVSAVVPRPISFGSPPSVRHITPALSGDFRRNLAGTANCSSGLETLDRQERSSTMHRQQRWP